MMNSNLNIVYPDMEKKDVDYIDEENVKLIINNILNIDKLSNEGIKVMKGTISNKNLNCSLLPYFSKNDILIILSIIGYYFGKYLTMKGIFHPSITSTRFYQLAIIIADGYTGKYNNEIIEYENWFNMIDKHFETNYGECDYRIMHFFTDGVLKNRFYETRFEDV